ncbi:hypothetical protein VNO80_03155 [Phaseolus coccineus]|uniref:Uncharacterized protein n=1 Tax=Phaseolus coccineus TaxID=3886 RepID=A0AAN9NW93_PHACN
MTLAPGRSPHASRALAMPACLSRPDDARMSRALAMSACLSRPGDVRMPLAPWRCTPKSLLATTVVLALSIKAFGTPFWAKAPPNCCSPPLWFEPYRSKHLGPHSGQRHPQIAIRHHCGLSPID